MNEEVFFPAEWLARIGRCRLVPHSRFRGVQRGSSLSGRTGNSPDFSDFAEYHPGDDIRKVDWNVYGRTEKLYVRRYLDERELRVSVILDGTRSMAGGGRWLFARQLCAAIGLIALGSDDHFSAGLAGGTPAGLFSGKGARSRNAFLQKLTSLPAPAETGGFAEEAWKFAGQAATIRFLITDGLEPAGHFEALFRRMLAAGGETRLILVGGEDAAVPDVRGDFRFIDSETGKSVAVTLTPGARRAYEERRVAHRLAVAGICRNFGIRLLEVQPAEGIPGFVNGKMRGAGWIR
ncbi:DUF58 domain-containing protein [Bhargavaea ullalensis]|uniref:Uncharacterized protein (DUF58 family) n=1 Tax=Bhargavaea ullalensis TaxID=1265685 RepID=A0ABV2GC01_9BACL